MHLRFMLPSFPWTAAFNAGQVEIPGASYECAPYIENAPDRFEAFATGAFEVGEDGVRSFIAKLLKGHPRSALPVFLDRELSQRNILVRADSPLAHPRDLVGKRIGSRLSPQSGTGAAVLMVLERGYGIPLGDLVLRMGDQHNHPTSRMALRLSGGCETDQENLDLLIKGALDAVISNLEGRYWSLFGPEILDHEAPLPPGVRSLVADPTAIAEIYRSTGLYPITDVVLVRPQLLNEHREMVPTLMQSFADAESLACQHRSGIEEHLAQLELALLGDNPHLPGLTENACLNLDAFIDLLYRLGAIERKVGVDEIFASQ